MEHAPLRPPASIKIHVVEPQADRRAVLFRDIAVLGIRAELYCDLDEYFRSAPTAGVLLLSDDRTSEDAVVAMGRLTAERPALPFICYAQDIVVSRVVGAMRAGAVDYLELPLRCKALTNAVCLATSSDFVSLYADINEARGRVSRLTTRERQVLDHLATGNSNREIARELDISAKTVEIHRANMIGKLRAGTTIGAVGIGIRASLLGREGLRRPHK